jgi:hypothetical protein
MNLKTTITLLLASTLCAVADDISLSMSDTNIVGWATGYTNYLPGTDVSTTWQTPTKALGEAAGTSTDIVCLGRNGEITLTFSTPIIDGNGYDFAVFENGFSATFLELAWVEVSSDGTHFVRFPNYSLTENTVGAFGSVDPDDITGLASEFKQGLGTQFDLSILTAYYTDQTSDTPTLSLDSAFTEQLTSNYPWVDLDHIGYIKLIDIVGDGTATDAVSHVIYDPYPTSGSAGFDLDAIAVLNQQSSTLESQTITFTDIPHQKLSTGTLELNASADSGLAVCFSLLDGAATLTDSTIIFTNSGSISIQADQTGDSTYAPAAPVVRTFYVAESLQHIWIEPIPNLIVDSDSWQIHATSSSGLWPTLEVYDGPSDVLINTNTLMLTIGSETGTVTLRATQTGSDTVAPADDLYYEFEIVESDATNAPQTFAEWTADPSTIFPYLTQQSTTNQYTEKVLQISFAAPREARTRTQFQTTQTLTNTWTNAIPEIIFSEPITTNGQQATFLKVQIPIDPTNQFFRLLFEYSE